MQLKLIHKDGWDIIVKGNFVYYQIQDELGNNRAFFKTNLTETFDVSDKEYKQIKYGENYLKFINLIGTNNDSTVLKKDGSLICTGFRDYFFFFIDENGEITEKREDIGFDSIYSFDQDKNGHIWYAIPTAHYIGQYSLKEGKEIYHLGEKYEDGKPLSFPEDIKIYNEFVYISNMNNKQVIKLNSDNKEWEIYLNFNEAVWEYRQFKEIEIVRLQSGIYIIER